MKQAMDAIDKVIRKGFVITDGKTPTGDAPGFGGGMSASERVKKAWITRHAHGEVAHPDQNGAGGLSGGEAKIDEIVGKQGYVSFSKPEAIQAFMATHKGDKWGGHRQADGSVRFFPIGGSYHKGMSGLQKGQGSPRTSGQLTTEQYKNAVTKAPMIGGRNSPEGGLRRSSLHEHNIGKVINRNGGTLPVGTRFVDEDGNIGAYMGSHKAPNGAVMHKVKMANGKEHVGYAAMLPNLFLEREVRKFV